MCQCWANSPNERPTFIDLVQTLSDSLDSKAGYMAINAFTDQIRKISFQSAISSLIQDQGVTHDQAMNSEEITMAKASEPPQAEQSTCVTIIVS